MPYTLLLLIIYKQLNQLIKIPAMFNVTKTILAAANQTRDSKF